MAFYRQDPEMAYCLKGLLDRFEKEGRPSLQENIAITCIRYDQENPSSSSGFGTGWNSNKNFYPASVVKIVYALATQVWLQQDLIVDSEELYLECNHIEKGTANPSLTVKIDLYPVYPNRVEGMVFNVRPNLEVA